MGAVQRQDRGGVRPEQRGRVVRAGDEGRDDPLHPLLREDRVICVDVQIDIYIIISPIMQVARKLLNLHNCFSTLALAEVNAAKLSKNSNKLLAATHKFGEDVSPIH